VLNSNKKGRIVYDPAFSLLWLDIDLLLKELLPPIPVR